MRSEGLKMRVVLVALFMVLSTHVSAQEAQGVAVETPSPKEAEQEQTNAGDDEAWESSLPVRIVETPDQAAHASEREAQSDKHESDDLEAQQLAAQAAAQSAASADRQEYLARWQLGLSGFGVLALIVTIIYSIEATKAAVRAAEAADQTFKADNLPFLILKPIDGQKVRFNTDLSGVARVVPKGLGCIIENTGRGQAIVTAIFRRWQRTDPTTPPNSVKGELGTSRKTITMPVGPGSQSPTIHSLSGDHAKTGERFGENDWAYFLGYIEYIDGMSQDKYVSGFCYVLRPDEVELGLHVAMIGRGDDSKYWYHEKAKEAPAA